MTHVFRVRNTTGGSVRIKNLSLSLLLPVLLAGPPSGPDHAVLSAVANAYEANRASLASGVFRFRYAIGSAPTSDDAVSGRWSRRSEAEGFYALSAENRRYEILPTLETLVKDRVKRGDRWVSSLHSVRALTDGKLTLWDGIAPSEDGRELVHTAQIDGGSDRFDSSFFFPLGLGHPASRSFQLSKDIRKALAGEDGWRISIVDDDQPEKAASERSLHIVITGERGRLEYWVDLERGAVPTRIRDTSAETGAYVQITHHDIRHLGNTTWLPFHEVVYFEDGLVRELTIEQAEVDRPTPSEVFRLKFDEAIAVINARDMKRYAPQQVWDLRRLPGDRSHSSTSIALSQPAETGPPMPGPSGSSVPSRWFLTAGGIAVVVAGAFAWRARTPR